MRKDLFMANYIADTVIEQLPGISGYGKFQLSDLRHFVDRIQQLTDLSEQEKSDYIQKNAYMLKTYVLPAYPQLSSRRL